MKITELVVLRTYFMKNLKFLKNLIWGALGVVSKLGALDLPKSSSQKLQ